MKITHGKTTAKSSGLLAMLGVIVGISMIVAAAGVVIWTETQHINITKTPLIVTDTLQDVDMMVNSSQNFTITVENPSSGIISVTLGITGPNDITVEVNESLTQSIAGQTSVVYHITITILETATVGNADIVYSLVQG
jgi:hypothetical protein